jgi:hypothetical protein
MVRFARHMDRCRRAACLVALLGVAACASLSGPRTIHTRDLPSRPVYDPAWITSDRAAAAVAMAVMEHDLGLPRLDVAMHFLPNRDAFRLALIEDGYDPSFAHETSTQLDAIAGHRRVFFNSAALSQLPWPQRAGFFGHELTHTLQYELGGGVRGTSDQWLREGFADWVGARVLAAIGAMPLEAFRQQRIRAYRQASALPPLNAMASFPDWVALLGANSPSALAGKAYLAVELLVERHGVEAVLDYFGRFAASQDRLGHFAAAFGEPLSQFEVVAEERLQSLR